MSKGFYGAGCPHPRVECFMQQIQKLQEHYGCDSNLGLKMSVSIEMLIVELGVLVQQFQESFYEVQRLGDVKLDGVCLGKMRHV